MADAKSKEQREKEWWDAWWAEDYSWAGLAEKKWRGWIVVGDAVVEAETGVAYGVAANRQRAPEQLEGRPATLQDYWRAELSTGLLRPVTQMEDELVSLDGGAFHIAHLPPRLKSGAPTLKADVEHAHWEHLEALIAARIAAGAEKKVNTIGRAEGPDGRAQLAGAVLRRAAAHPQSIGSPVHLAASRAIWLGNTDWGSFRFGPGADFESAAFTGNASFRGAAFSGSASFQSAAFSGDADFTSAQFSGNALFDSATFCGDASFFSATFSGYASFKSATFSGGASFWSATFSGNASFKSAIFSGNAGLLRKIQAKRKFLRRGFVEEQLIRSSDVCRCSGLWESETRGRYRV